jgi:hypothetical protein
MAAALERCAEIVDRKHYCQHEKADVELADAVIRSLDVAAARGYDIGGGIVEKREARAATEREHTDEETRNHADRHL